MIIVVSIILVRQSSFNGSVLLRSQAYEVALQLRDIQLNAVSASYDENNFRSVLGAYFNETPGSNDSYKIFRDADSDNFYDVAEEFGIQGSLDSRFEIREIRADGVAVTGSDLSVIFERPNFDARFFDGANSEVTAAVVEIDVARVGTVGNSTGEIRTVEITSAGQISVP